MDRRKTPTMRDVAQRAGVSPATVSNVLALRRSVDPELAERVRKAAADLDYAVDRAASQLRSGKSPILAIVVPSLENPFFTSLIAAIEKAVRAGGFEIIVASSSENAATERARLTALLSFRPSGLVIVPATDAFPAREFVESAGVPYVLVDRVAQGLAGDSVTIDNKAAAALATRHLIDKGHRLLLVVASSLALANIRARVEGVEEACRAAGLNRPEILETGFGIDSTIEAVGRRLKAAPIPGAVFALTNTLTMGVLSAVSSAGLRLNDDISLVGFDDYAWMRVANPPITAIRQPVEQMGRFAWECLEERIRARRVEPRRHTLHCTLEIRQSTATSLSGRSGGSPALPQGEANGRLPTTAAAS